MSPGSNPGLELANAVGVLTSGSRRWSSPSPGATPYACTQLRTLTHPYTLITAYALTHPHAMITVYTLLTAYDLTHQYALTYPHALITAYALTTAYTPITSPHRRKPRNVTTVFRPFLKNLLSKHLNAPKICRGGPAERKPSVTPRTEPAPVARGAHAPGCSPARTRSRSRQRSRRTRGDGHARQPNRGRDLSPAFFRTRVEQPVAWSAIRR